MSSREGRVDGQRPAANGNVLTPRAMREFEMFAHDAFGKGSTRGLAEILTSSRKGLVGGIRGYLIQKCQAWASLRPFGG